MSSIVGQQVWKF